MHRIRIVLPKRESVAYRNLDMLHDAIVNALTNAGANADDVTGFHARPWHFGALGWHSKGASRCHTLIVGTPDEGLAECLKRIQSEDIRHARAQTAEAVDFSRADIVNDADPVGGGQGGLGIIMLSPLAISKRNTGKTRQWHTDLGQFDPSPAINGRLSRLTGRDVALMAAPDRLYLRSRPRHDTLVQTKETKGGGRAFVIGMRAPMVLQGSDADLKLAWYAGIGEKNRNGFGCIGLLERGVGR